MDDRLTGILDGLLSHAERAGARFVHADELFAESVS
jgi:hypothetical protein